MRRNNKGIKDRSEPGMLPEFGQHWMTTLNYWNALHKYFNSRKIFQFSSRIIWAAAFVIDNYKLDFVWRCCQRKTNSWSGLALNSPELVMSVRPISKMIQTREEPATVFWIHKEARSGTLVILLRNGEDLRRAVTRRGLGRPDTHFPPEDNEFKTSQYFERFTDLSSNTRPSGHPYSKMV